VLDNTLVLFAVDSELDDKLVGHHSAFFETSVRFLLG
jgi:hypothetical protein